MKFSVHIFIIAEISYCDVNPCRFGGECRPIGTGTQGGCVCKHGYSGQYCEGSERSMYIPYQFKEVGSCDHKFLSFFS